MQSILNLNHTSYLDCCAVHNDNGATGREKGYALILGLGICPLLEANDSPSRERALGTCGLKAVRVFEKGPQGRGSVKAEPARSGQYIEQIGCRILDKCALLKKRNKFLISRSNIMVLVFIITVSMRRFF